MDMFMRYLCPNGFVKLGKFYTPDTFIFSRNPYLLSVIFIRRFNLKIIVVTLVESYIYFILYFK